MSKVFAKLRSVGYLGAMALLGVGSVSAETLMMPNRDTLTGTNTVVWGVSTLANGTAYTIDFGDGTIANGVVADRSYIAFNHTYALANTYTATLTVGAETATVAIRAYAAADLTPENLRGLNVNRAIQDGLRYQWTSQLNRQTNFPAGVTTSWQTFGGFPQAYTSLVVSAFQNHGYKLPNSNAAPTGLYEKYIVRRGQNYIMTQLTVANLGVQPAGDPCVGLPGALDPCVGFQIPGGDSGYATPLAALAFATSGAPTRVNTEVAGITANKTIGEILQRLSNSIVWGQGETGNARGSWYYTLNANFNGDGSTVGWGLLALLDAAAAGAVVPPFARTEFAFGLTAGHNTDGSLDYQFDGNPAFFNSVGIEKGGISLQGMFFIGETAPFAAGSRGANTVTYIANRWTSGRIGNDTNWGCQASAAPVHPAATAQFNFGCAYSMFNTFKGLGLHGITNLPGVGDWYRQYVDWLVANQTNPTTIGGGNWASMQFSCCESDQAAKDAVALLILSPVVLLAPDPQTFSLVGLKQGTPLSTDPDTNPVGTLHTVVAKAESAGGAPIPGVTISFQVTGRNSATGSGVSNAAGEVSFSYTDTGPTGSNGQDAIRAFIGQIGSNVASNILEKNWLAAQAIVCDVDNNGVVNNADLTAIRNKNGQLAAPGDPFDPNGDGRINVADVRYCQLRLTPL